MSAANHDAVFLSRDGMVDKLAKDMYFGNGKPAMTVRMEALETSQERIERLLARLIWLGVGTFLTVAGELILKMVTK